VDRQGVDISVTVCLFVCLFVLLRISPPMPKLAASKFAPRFSLSASKTWPRSSSSLRGRGYFCFFVQ